MAVALTQVITEDRASGAQVIDGSLKFVSGNSTHLTRTPSGAGNRRTWTFSCWVKVGSLSQGERGTIFSSNASGNLGGPTIYQDSGLRFAHAWDPTGADYIRETVALFRDPSAWYHVVWWCDMTQAGTRWKIYVNGVEQTLQTAPSNNGEPDQNTELGINSADEHTIGEFASYSYLDGYLSQAYFVDGQALDASYFGFTDGLTNTWRPKKYTGTYGTNGFYLPMDNQSDFEIDKSGNGNNWTKNGFSGTANDPDVLPDSPSGISYSTNSVSGITTVSQKKPTNWCTLSATSSATSNLPSGYTKRPPFDGNLSVTFGQGQAGVDANFGITPNSGKFYWEVNVDTSGSNQSTTRWGVLLDGSNWDIRNAQDIASVSNGDVLGFAVDANAGTIDYYKNNTLQGTSPYQTFTSGWKLAVPWMGVSSNGSRPNSQYTFNFGQKPFKYNPPDGFQPLCLANLPRPTKAAVRPDKYFNTVLYTGNGSTQSITGVGFQPDFVWCKSRSEGVTNYTGHGVVQDTVRGTGNTAMVTNEDYSEANTGYSDAVTSFDRDGFTLGSRNQVNYNGHNFVAWCWKAGGAAVTNNDGSAASQVSANRDSGFSIVTYTGQAANFTWGHGLGVAPSMVWIKRRDTNAGWSVYHKSLGATKRIQLNQEIAEETMAYFQNTAPTDTVFSVTTNGGVGADGATYLAYCWSEVPGFSKFGSYTGNGNADGVFIHLGFRPAWVMWKQTNTDNDRHWVIRDSVRDVDNPVGQTLYSSTPTGEQSLSAQGVDFLSNGFKIRSTWDYQNASSRNYIFAAFAEAPTNNLFGGHANAR